MKRLTLIPLPLLCLAVGLSACSDKNGEDPFEPEAPRLTGDISVQVMTTTGPAYQGDVGYAVMLDGVYSGEVGPGGYLTIRDVSLGRHTVRLVQIPEDCRATDGSSKEARVEPGQTSEVYFPVHCGVLRKRWGRISSLYKRNPPLFR